MKEPKRPIVYFAPCGIGLGHMARCEPLARALEDNGLKTIFSTYLDGLAYSRGKGLSVLEAYPISFKVKPDGTIDFKSTASRSGFSLGARAFLRQLVKEIEYIRGVKPKLVVSDSRASSLLAAWLLRVPAVLILNQFRVEIIKGPSKGRLSIADKLFFMIANLAWIFVRGLIMWVWARAKYIFIPDFPPPYTISQRNLVVPRRYLKKLTFIGPILTHGQRAQDASSSLRPGLDASKPLIYAAVSGPRVERRYLAKELIRLLGNFPLEYEIVISKGEPLGSREPRRQGKVLVYDWVEDQEPLLARCDVLIGRAGHTTIMKALYYGKPMLLIPIPDQTEQAFNARMAAKLGVAKVLEQHELNEESLIQAVESLMQRRQAAKELSYRLRDLKLGGIGTVKDLVLGLVRLT